jgi:heme/copper-type cytochrome/quinol oxidase subunit 1
VSSQVKPVGQWCRGCPREGGPGPARARALSDWLPSTDHKVIGYICLITRFTFFCLAGVMALLLRIQLLGPDNHVVSDQPHNKLFTMHGTIMLSGSGTILGGVNYCSSLEWGASWPPPRHNFVRIPRIRSERPVFDLHCPHIVTGEAFRGLEQRIPDKAKGFMAEYPAVSG